jgi:exosortase/archaeosortase family protein
VAWQGIDRATLGVVGRFAVYFGGLVAAIMLSSVAGWLNSTLVGTAIVSTKLVTWAGIAAERSGALIHLHSRTLSIDLPCTAVFIVALYVALVVAYPVSVRDRLLGIALGVPIILVFNFGRIVAAAAVSESNPAAFTFFHDYLFQVGMVLVTVAAWAAWLSIVRRDAR